MEGLPWVFPLPMMPVSMAMGIDYDELCEKLIEVSLKKYDDIE